MTSAFKAQNPLERRKEESARIRTKYPDRCPVIVERAPRSNIADIDKQKYAAGLGRRRSLRGAAPVGGASSRVVPFVLGEFSRSSPLPLRSPLTLSARRFLVPLDLTVGQLCYVIRKRIK